MTRIQRFATAHPLTFVLAALLGWLLVAAAGVALYAAVSGRPANSDAAQSAGMLLATAALLALSWRLRWLRGMGMARPGPWRAWLAAALAGGFLVVVYKLAFYGRVDLDPGVFVRSARARAILGRQLVVGLAEESLFRGLLLYPLACAWRATRRGRLAAVFVPALLFALPHVGQLAVGISPAAIALLLGDAIISGIWWGASVLRWNALWPMILVHSASNLAVQVQGLGTAASLGVAGYGRAILFTLPLLLYGLWLLGYGRAEAVTKTEASR